MNNDYLWDKTGTPDPEIERLEDLLSDFRHRAPLRSLDSRRSHWQHLAAAAAVTAVLASASWLLMWSPKTVWTMAKVDRAGFARPDTLAVGEWLETDSKTEAKLDVGGIGELTVQPNSRLKLVRSLGTEHRVSLQRGEVEAFIWAPPRQFFVDTPSAVAVDLGCRYTLSVDDSGTGTLKVLTGWVAFEARGRESFIPAGAGCKTRRETGPGIPYYLDAAEPLQRSAEQFESDHDLNTMLAQARPKDAMTLWHLMSRVQGEERNQVYTRMASLVAPPPQVTREGVMRLDSRMMDEWWNQLGLDDASWWRKWKGPWRQ